MSMLSERWDFVFVLFALTALARLSPRLRRHISAWVLPTALLLARKVVLFVPVSGAVSTEDRVVFWSATAYWYHFILLVLFVLIVLGIRYRERLPWDSLGCLSLVLLVVLVGCAAWMLPIVGLSYFYMPVIALLGATKLLLVSPALWWVAWLTLFVQTVFLLSGAAGAGREVNKLALTCVLLSGAGYFGVQAIASAPSIVAEINNGWKATAEPDAGKTLPGVSGMPENWEPTFLDFWVEKLPEMERLGLNVVERRVPYDNPASVRGRAAPRMSHPWGMDSQEWAAPASLLWGGLIFVLLLLLAERLPTFSEVRDQFAAGGVGRRQGR
jgi:hypothetical protein